MHYHPEALLLLHKERAARSGSDGATPPGSLIRGKGPGGSRLRGALWWAKRQRRHSCSAVATMASSRKRPG